MDALFENLRQVSFILMPIVGLICLIFLALILYRIYVVVKALPTTVDKVNGVLDSTQESVDQLQGPLNTINNVTQTVDMVNNSAISAVTSIAKYGAKNSEAIVNWTRDFMDKRSAAKAAKYEENEEKDEDFGVYE